MSKFRNEVNNSRYTKSLFFEMTLKDKSAVVYTLKDTDHEGYPSLYRLYMQTQDPTEWRFAHEHLDGWEHWEMLCETSWFKPHVERWRNELELKIRSEALGRIMAESKSSSRNAFVANRYVLERGWEAKDGNRKGAGRPSKADISRAASDLARADSRLSLDWDRIARQ